MSKLKERIEILQSVFTILAIIVGGIWSYNIFIKERKHYPHANIYQQVQHYPLNADIHLVRVALKIENSGTSRLLLTRNVQMIQQILPIPPCSDLAECAVDQINNALSALQRDEDRFSWQVIAKRETNFEGAVDIEPGEHETLDYEFVIPSKVKLIRVYSYFRNDQKSTTRSDETGWSTSSIYSLEDRKEIN